MNPLFKEKIMADYPDWHYKPFRLTIAEMNNPHKVIDQFFDRYDLPQIRTCLKDMLYDAIWMDDNDAPMHVATHDDLEKLIDAAWLLRKKKLMKTSSIIQLTRIEDKDLPKDYKNIQEFFDSITLPKALEYLTSAIRAAEAMGIWEMSTPNDLLNFFESLDSLFESVYNIVTDDNIMEKAALSRKYKNPDLTNYSLYCANYDQLMSWDYFPRSLSTKEFRDPYKALALFKSIRVKEDWKEILDYIMNGALSKKSLTESGIYLETFTISEQLRKVIEGCHLIYVRTTFKRENI
ncbi:MAG: hypothetical protein HYI21_10800 [Sediminibacterium sp. Gen4]|jgi:hypothetical protein|uniref:hypothetical protein n=1 Tax=Sediminibacterium sp. Gen4 TaxID=2736285 RepID=UPI0015B80EA0|nr:hypothetical protein [Sediminibacterium sp. Gen4]MBW0162193.1 hypothetical protein [Sediminibacterium sp.]NWK66507.1 hypothetical protein [Sediminibacterium sp. Gen4]